MEIFGKKIDGAFIIIAVLVIAGVTWGIVSMVLGMMSKGSEMIAAQAGVLDNYQYQAYDNKYVSGDTVVAAIKLIQTPAPNKLKILVKTMGDMAGASYGFDNASANYKPYLVTDPSSVDFINPTATFQGTLVKTNGVINEIDFTQQM